MHKKGGSQAKSSERISNHHSRPCINIWSLHFCLFAPLTEVLSEVLPLPKWTPWSTTRTSNGSGGGERSDVNVVLKRSPVKVTGWSFFLLLQLRRGSFALLRFTNGADHFAQLRCKFQSTRVVFLSLFISLFLRNRRPRMLH